jgi:hypothetical protein
MAGQLEQPNHLPGVSTLHQKNYLHHQHHRKHQPHHPQIHQNKHHVTKRPGSRKGSVPIAHASSKKMDHASKRLAHYACSLY